MTEKKKKRYIVEVYGLTDNGVRALLFARTAEGYNYLEALEDAVDDQRVIVKRMKGEPR